MSVDFWCTFVPFGATAFALGYLAGWFSESHKEHTMRVLNTARRWFDRWWRPLYLAALLIGVAGVVIAASAAITNVRQDRVQGVLIGCVNDYASASASTSQAVREAADTLAVAQLDATTALQDLVDYIAERDPDPVEAETLFAAFRTANGEYVDAQIELATVRAENPVPDPPEKFCDAD